MKGSKSILLVDNFDSFTFTIADYLLQLGATVEVKSRSDVSPNDFSPFDGVLFSPGPGNPTEMPELLELIKAAISAKPVFGICLGFQAIGYIFGAEILQGLPMHGKLSTISIENPEHWLFSQIPYSFEVVRYHSLIVSELKSPLVGLAHAEGGELMAFAHENLPVAGVQFHPEAHLTAYGLRILENWLNLC